MFPVTHALTWIAMPGAKVSPSTSGNVLAQHNAQQCSPALYRRGNGSSRLFFCLARPTMYSSADRHQRLDYDFNFSSMLRVPPGVRLNRCR